MKLHLQICQAHTCCMPKIGYLCTQRSSLGSLLAIPGVGFTAAMSPQGLQRLEVPLSNYEWPLCVPCCCMGM